MRKYTSFLAMALTAGLLGCSDSPEAKKANDDAAKAAQKAADATGDALVKGTKALGKQLQEGAEEVERKTDDATIKKAE